MTTEYDCAIFPFCGGGKRERRQKNKAFYDWATTGISVINDTASPILLAYHGHGISNMSYMPQIFYPRINYL